MLKEYRERDICGKKILWNYNPYICTCVAFSIRKKLEFIWPEVEDKCFKGCLYRVRCADGFQWLRKQASETPSMIPELKSLLEAGKIRTYMQKKKKKGINNGEKNSAIFNTEKWDKEENFDIKMIHLKNR